MVYIFGTSMPNKLKMKDSLTKIFGLGGNDSKQIMRKLGITEKTYILELTKTQKLKLIRLLETSTFVLKLELKREKINYLNKLIKIKSYRGSRLLQNLPSRGQRTHTNRKTSKKSLNAFSRKKKLIIN